MKISIITASYNDELLISETYRSILSQTHTNWEWLITDDCSSDGTQDILYEIQNKDNRVKVFKNSVNSGAAISRNNSIKNATGAYIAFLDSDDLWECNKLEVQLHYMKNNNVDFSFTSYQLISEKGDTLGIHVDRFKSLSVRYEDMLRKKATLGCSTVMLKKEAFSDIAMPEIRTGQDYALWLKLLKSIDRAVLIPVCLSRYRIVKGSISRNKFKKAMRQWHIYREIEKLPLLKSCEYFLFYAFRALFRR